MRTLTFILMALLIACIVYLEYTNRNGYEELEVIDITDRIKQELQRVADEKDKLFDKLKE